MLFVVSHHAFAIDTFSIERSDLGSGLIQFALVKENSQWFLYKNTNVFDGKNKLGKFVVKDASVITEEIERLSHLEVALMKTESRLGEMKAENPFKHQSYYKLGKYKIDAVDSYYPEVKKVFSRILDKIVLISIDTLEVEKKDQTLHITEIKKSLVKNKSQKLIKEFCSYDSELYHCVFKEFGTIILNEN